MRRFLAGALALIALVGCAPTPVAPPPWGVIHVFERVGAPVRRVRVGEVDRPALDVQPVGFGLAGTVVVPVDGLVRVVVPAKDQRAARAGGAVTANAVIQHEPRALDGVVEPGAEPVVVLRFPPADAGLEATYVAFVQPLWTMGTYTRLLPPLDVPADSRLQLALGLPSDLCARAALPGVVVGVDVVAHGVVHPLVRERLSPPDACLRWRTIERTLPVSGPGMRIRVRLRAQRRVDRTRLVDAGVADLLVVPPVTDRPRPPNVVLVSLDTLGARRLGAYGHLAPTSPTFDRATRRGTLFERAMTHYPSTAAGHMSMLTGLLPAAHGVRGLNDVVSGDVRLLAERLSSAGYVTVAFTEDATLARGMGFSRGFDRYEENRTNLYETPGVARETFRRARRWLRAADRTRPFFAFLHTYEVHTPYRPPPRYVPLVRPRLAPTAPRDPSWLHDAEILFLDRLLGPVLRDLAAPGLAEDTIVIVTADHGESFGQHGHHAHGTCIHDEVMHVPLLVIGPGIVAGRRAPERVGLVDLVPTVLELTGVPLDDALDGRSLVPALRGAPLPERPVIAELRGALGPRKDIPQQDFRAVWLGDRKVLWDVYQDRWIVYYTAADPGETRPLLGAAGRDTLREGQRLLADYEAVRPRGAARAPAPLDPEAIERLRTLGYVE